MTKGIMDYPRPPSIIDVGQVTRKDTFIFRSSIEGVLTLVLELGNDLVQQKKVKAKHKFVVLNRRVTRLVIKLANFEELKVVWVNKKS